MYTTSRDPLVRCSQSRIIVRVRQKYNGEPRSLSPREIYSADSRRQVGVVHPPRRWTGSLKKCKCNRCPGERARLMLGKAERATPRGVDLSNGDGSPTLRRSHQLRSPNRSTFFVPTSLLVHSVLRFLSISIFSSYAAYVSRLRILFKSLQIN